MTLAGRPTTSFLAFTSLGIAYEAGIVTDSANSMPVKELTASSRNEMSFSRVVGLCIVPGCIAKFSANFAADT